MNFDDKIDQIGKCELSIHLWMIRRHFARLAKDSAIKSDLLYTLTECDNMLHALGQELDTLKAETANGDETKRLLVDVFIWQIREQTARVLESEPLGINYFYTVAECQRMLRGLELELINLGGGTRE